MAMSDEDEELIEALTADFSAVLDNFAMRLAKQRPVACDGNVALFRARDRLDARETEIVLSAFVGALGDAMQFRADRASVDAVLEKLGADPWYGWIRDAWSPSDARRAR
jgi:hypothetical protein